MSTRTKRSIVTFSAPFELSGVDQIQPAGDYAVDQDEELMEGLSWLAYRRVATFLHLPAISANSRPSQLIAVDPAELEAVLQQGQKQTQ